MRPDEPINLDEEPVSRPRSQGGFSKSRKPIVEESDWAEEVDEILRRTVTWLPPMIAVVAIGAGITFLVMQDVLASQSAQLRTAWAGIAQQSIAETTEARATRTLRQAAVELENWAAARKSMGAIVEDIVSAPSDARLVRLVLKAGMQVDMDLEGEMREEDIRPFRVYELQWIGSFDAHGGELEAMDYVNSLSENPDFRHLAPLRLQGVIRPKAGADSGEDRRDFGVSGVSGRMSL